MRTFLNKRLFILLVLVCAGASSFAQFGIQVGWNTSGYKYSKNDIHETRAWNWGVNAGVLYSLGGKYICVQPTLLYTQKGATNNNDGANFVDSILKFTNKLNYLELSLPVILKVPLGTEKCSLDLGVGPYMSRLLSAVSKAKHLYDNGTKNTNFKIGSASTDDFKRSDIGLSIYMGARFHHFNMCMGYDIGLTNVTPTPGEVIRNGCFSINIGAFF